MELATIRAHPLRPHSSMMLVPASNVFGANVGETNRKECSEEGDQVEMNDGADTGAAIAARPYKRVHFDTDPPSVFDDESDSCSSSSSSSTWYSPSEMDTFREVVREAGRKAHIHQLERLAGRASAAAAGCGVVHVRPSSPPPTRDANMGGIDEDEADGRTSRGLDYRSSLERQRNRLIAIRAVLECQRRLRSGQLPATCPSAAAANVSPDVHLALISAKCTRWARELAALIGRRDFYEAYPQFRSELDDDPIPDVSTLNCLKPFPTSLKRSISTGMAKTRTAAAQPKTVGNVASAKSDTPIGSDSCPTPALLTATRIAEEEDSDDEARRRLGIPTKRRCGRKRRREGGASSSCESSSGSEARSAAAVLAGC